jgi:hypothetical protein
MREATVVPDVDQALAREPQSPVDRSVNLQWAPEETIVGGAKRRAISASDMVKVRRGAAGPRKSDRTDA